MNRANIVGCILSVLRKNDINVHSCHKLWEFFTTNQLIAFHCNPTFAIVVLPGGSFLVLIYWITPSRLVLFIILLHSGCLWDTLRVITLWHIIATVLVVYCFLRSTFITFVSLRSFVLKSLYINMTNKLLIQD